MRKEQKEEIMGDFSSILEGYELSPKEIQEARELLKTLLEIYMAEGDEGLYETISMLDIEGDSVEFYISLTVFRLVGLAEIFPWVVEDPQTMAEHCQYMVS